MPSTARRMHEGLDNWDRERSLSFYTASPCALVILTMQAKRPYGHVGYFIEDSANETNLMAHASSSKGVIASKVSTEEDNYYFDKIEHVFILKTRAE